MVFRSPGLKFGFTGKHIAITFGPHTIDTTLIGYRIDGQDWQFTNATTNATHLLVSPSTPGIDLSSPINPSTFELRVTNWACKWLKSKRFQALVFTLPNQWTFQHSTLHTQR